MKVVTLGEIMMRLSVPGFGRFVQATSYRAVYGGSEANVAVSLQVMGVPAAHVTRFPDNDFGVAATQALRQYGVDTSAILYGPERIGLYFYENGAVQRPPRIIYDRFDSAFAHIQPGMIDWDQVFQGASWFHWTGITPAISQGAADVCYEAIQFARKNGLTVSGDINYRRNLWQYGKSAREIMPALMEGTDVVVAGITDMENCAGVTGASFEDACRAYQKMFPVTKKIATTFRDAVSSSHNRLTGVLWSGNQITSSRLYDITHMVDRIGGGDAFMAGLIYGLIHQRADTFTIEYATAASTLKHTIEGDVNLASVQEIEALMKGENVGKLLR